MASSQWLEEEYGLIGNSDSERLLKRIVSRLNESIPSSGISRDPQFFASVPWQVQILSTNDPNALSTGAGTIYVTKGLFRILQNESQLAAIIAHEMSHQILGHTVSALDEQRSSTKDTAPQPAFAFSLERELEADNASLRLLRAARYDLGAALDALAIGYRPVQRLVAGEDRNWLDIRMTNLKQALAFSYDFQPATQNSREFNKVRVALEMSR